ncbi:ATP-binding cassette sub-family A member 2-like [Contarinia nasturtii]|uniref:ATP-binding cassette sub-family A member 2-like n=1 Tax=Contarinia nasturtii TaxID=265458 RepID=UPI0012D49386|nr:ATP-binding cassette sub-family A member 2-like [Contarinia nasturtii]
MAYGCRLIVELERMGDGLHFFNVFDSTASESGLSVGIVGCLMLVTSIVLIFATFCIERVFNKSTNGSTKNNKEESSDEEPAKLEPKYFERNIYDYEPGVQLINLRKEFENDIVICNDLTFEMYRDQVTVLLGHDGCGKSTAIKMLTGMIQPTSGTAIINGFDINTDRVEARQSIGICPQHNFLLDELTAGEHIEFFCRLKGLSRSDVKNEVKKYVELLKLESIINKRADELSRGMKRKIAFCIALCGGSTVIVCDELTNGAGMDPLAKRELWNALESEKIGRTIILTTQFVDEADVLGDRIAIMANGEFKCGGSPFFLKKRFSDGYRLTCVKEDGCDSSKITKILKKHIPDIEIHKEVATEVSYILPYNEMGHFEKICTLLENGLKQLKLFNYGVSSPELDEVFLKLGSDKTNEKPILVDDDTVYEKYDAAFGCSLYVYQCLAMLKKRYYCWITNFKLFAILHHIPMLFIGMSMFFYRNASSYYTLPYLNITLDPYSETVTMLQWDDSINEQIKIIFESYRMETDEKAGETLDKFSENIEERFLEWVKSVEIRSNKRNLIGLSSDNVVLTAFYNGQIFHAAPLALNRLYNAIMKAKLGECALGISVANWPLPFRNQSKLIQTSKDSNIANQMATNTSFAMAFVMAFYVIFYIRERISKTKILQFVVGVNKAIFWTSSLVFDIFLHLITSVIFCATVAVFREKYWSTTEELTILFIVLTLFGLSTLAIVRVASFIFKHDSLGFVGLAVFFIITGVCPYQLIAVLRSSPVNLAQVADILEGFFLLFPHYAMSYSLLNMNRYQIQAETQHVNSSDISIYDWSEPGIGRSLTYMTIVTIVLFSILLVNEFRLVQHALYYAHGLHKKELPTIETTERINPDVQAEKNKVNEISMADYSIVLQNLTKFYGNVPAVKDLCLAIERGECFGLLGMNGAGKTSTFRMLTGGTSISSGDVFVTGLNLKSHKLQAGYCPEYNALLEDLKGKQILEIFALLHGIRPGDISKRISELADDLNFKKHMNERIKRYKSGDKRKLQTAIALIGTPPAIYLDAPSSGIDPASKRNLWSVISKVRRSGASIMLTTHSLEECEALCTRLAIMVKGELKCLGSAQYLKNRFRKGYLLQIKISPQTKPRMTKLDPETTMLQLVNFINRNFPDATLERKNHGLWTYFIPQTKKRQPSFMFGIMERARSTLGITDYSLTQTTIEQVFLSFGESSA